MIGNKHPQLRNTKNIFQILDPSKKLPCFYRRFIKADANKQKKIMSTSTSLTLPHYTTTWWFCWL